MELRPSHKITIAYSFFSNNMNEKQSMLTDEEMLRDSSQFYGIKHENICSLIGHIVDNGEPLAIFPWAESTY